VLVRFSVIIQPQSDHLHLVYPGIYLDKPHVNSVIDAIWGKWNAAEREVLHRGSRLLTRESANVMPAVLPDEVKENLKRWWLADGAAPLLEQWIIKSAWAKDRKVSELQRGQFTRCETFLHHVL
jgi:hypothetical protein